MTKKDYVAIPAAVHKAHTQHNGFNVSLRPVQTMSLYAGNLADMLQQENPRFDRARFLEACGTTEQMSGGAS